MIELTIPDKYSFPDSTGSLGSQKKYFYNGYWYKEDTAGCESISETLSSLVMSHSNYPYYVTYELVSINKKRGCRSSSIINNNESLITFKRLYNMFTRKHIEDSVFAFSDVQERYDFLVNTFLELLNVDISDYLDTILSLDLIIANPDRHYRNLFFIEHEGLYRPAPIFDNGQGLLANYNITNPLCDFEKCENILTPQTISGSFESQYLACKRSFKINYTSLFKDLEQFPDSRQKAFLTMRLNKYKALFDISLTD